MYWKGIANALAHGEMDERVAYLSRYMYTCTKCGCQDWLVYYTSAGVLAENVTDARHVVKCARCGVIRKIYTMSVYQDILTDDTGRVVSDRDMPKIKHVLW